MRSITRLQISSMGLMACAFFPSALPAQSYSEVSAIFAASCTGCHSAEAKMGGLNLESYEAVKSGGKHGTVIVPGKSAESKLFLMISGQAKPTMPMGGHLAAGEIAAIQKWIDAGAPAPTAAEVPVASAAAPKIEPKGKLKPQIFAMDYRPDGKMIAVAGYKQVRLIDPSTSKTLATLEGPAETVRAVAFSPNGKLLAAAGGLPARKGEVVVFENDKVLRTITGHADCIYAVTFSPDGKTLATAGYDKLIKLWDVETGKEIRTLKDHIDAIYALAFTPDGKRLISGAADRTVKIWNPETGERLYTLSEPSDGINTIAVSPDGKLLAAAGIDKNIRIWQLGEKNAKLLNTLIAHEDVILRLAWSPDGKSIASSSADRSIKIFNAADLTEIKTITPQSDWIYALQFSPDGHTLAAGRFDGTLTMYETSKTGLQPTPLASAQR